jgi:phosphonate transport system substrate-binding protein
MESVVLRFTTCQAQVAEPFCETLTAFIGQRLGIATEFICDIPWQERERLLDRGTIEVGWICGLPYVRKRSREGANIELLAAPIMKHPRYEEEPVYYSDVVVHAESRFRSFDDLRGATWAYNEPGSHSGYNLIRYHLAAGGMSGKYFSRVVESGSHRDSFQMVLKGFIDASAIDSTVLEMELTKDPAIAHKFRTIAVLGPSPAPPWVIHECVPGALRDALCMEFLAMHEHAEGRRILESAGILRFGRMSDSDYDPIREMDRVAAPVEW